MATKKTRNAGSKKIPIPKTSGTFLEPNAYAPPTTPKAGPKRYGKPPGRGLLGGR